MIYQADSIQVVKEEDFWCNGHNGRTSGYSITISDTSTYHSTVTVCDGCITTIAIKVASARRRENDTNN